MVQMASDPTYMKGDSKTNWFTVYVDDSLYLHEMGKLKKTLKKLFTVYAGDIMYLHEMGK